MRRHRLRVLVVSPNFPPVNAPDHFRIRMALPFLAEMGLQVFILACAPDHERGQATDDFLLEGVPKSVKVVRVRPLSLSLSARIGITNTALRSLHRLYRAGRRIIRREKIDLVFFTSTQFSCFLLGPLWKARTGVPYVLDFQDPWINDYYDGSISRRAPGGWKYRVIRFWRALISRVVIGGASGIIRTSRAYRFPHRKGPLLTLPFGVPTADFDLVRRYAGISRNAARRPRFVAVGRGGNDLAPGLRALFRTVARVSSQSPDLVMPQFDFIGTSYAPRGQGIRTVWPIGLQEGIPHLVREQTDRIPYRQSLEAMITADAIVVPLSADASYTPSKLASVMEAGRPILLLSPTGHPLAELLMRLRSGHVLFWDASDTDQEGALRHVIAASRDRGSQPRAPEEFHAATMTRRLVDFFRSILSREARK